MLFNRRQGFGFGCCPNPCMCQPVTEPTITKCIQRDFCHEVPHICPIHTHIVNRHVFRHTYAPQFTCSEENQIVNVDTGNCCQFM